MWDAAADAIPGSSAGSGVGEPRLRRQNRDFASPANPARGADD